MPTRTRRRPAFPALIRSILEESRSLGIRAGPDHRFTSIWFVVVDNRLFIRPWNDKPGGWHRALLRDGRGTMTLAGREIPVRARQSRGKGIFDAVDDAYAERYPTKGSQKWVRGFATARRRATTTELLPARAS